MICTFFQINIHFDVYVKGPLTGLVNERKLLSSVILYTHIYIYIYIYIYIEKQY